MLHLLHPATPSLSANAGKPEEIPGRFLFVSRRGSVDICIQQGDLRKIYARPPLEFSSTARVSTRKAEQLATERSGRKA